MTHQESKLAMAAAEGLISEREVDDLAKTGAFRTDEMRHLKHLAHEARHYARIQAHLRKNRQVRAHVRRMNR